MKVAIVGGTAGFGNALAVRLAHRGDEVAIGSRTADKAAAAAQQVISRLGEGAKVTAGANPEVVADCDLVFVAVPYAGQAGIYEAIRDFIPPGTTVIDATVPLAAEVGGKATRMLGVWEGSAAQQARAILNGAKNGKGVYLASGFHTVMAGVLQDLGRPIDADVLVCGDAEARKQAQTLVELLPGARFVDCGPLDTARILESLAALLIGINIRYKLHPGAGLKITDLE